MSAALTVEGTPFTYEVEANAGIVLSTGERWWGTLVKWRPGTSGRWRRFNLRDVHPFDEKAIRAALSLYLKQHDWMWKK